MNCFYNLPFVSFRWWSFIDFGNGRTTNKVTINASCMQHEYFIIADPYKLLHISGSLRLTNLADPHPLIRERVWIRQIRWSNWRINWYRTWFGSSSMSILLSIHVSKAIHHLRNGSKSCLLSKTDIENGLDPFLVWRAFVQVSTCALVVKYHVINHHHVDLSWTALTINLLFLLGGGASLILVTGEQQTR